MVELGQLEREHERFDTRGLRVVAVSLDGLEDSHETQMKFPHLVLLSDKDQGLAKAADVIGPHRGPDGGVTLSPTTILIDRSGKVRWVFRPERFINRLSPAELQAAVDEHMPRQ